MLFFSGSVTVSATTGLQFEQMVDFGRAWSCRSKDGFVYKGSECESYSATRLKVNLRFTDSLKNLQQYKMKLMGV